MFLNRYYIIVLSLFSYFFMHASEYRVEQFEYKQAELEDVSAIVELIDKKALHDADRIVVLPEKFRKPAVHSAVEKGRLFVAKHEARVIAFKKFFKLEGQEKQDVLRNEICCLGDETYPLEVDFTAQHNLECSVRNTIQSIIEDACGRYPVFYNGSDFTDPEFRGLGVNNRLMKKALSSVLSIYAAQSTVVVYGVTCENTGRTQGIVRNLREVMPMAEIAVAKYLAYKPSFDLSSGECIPLPKEKSIEGRGCVVLCESHEDAV